MVRDDDAFYTARVRQLWHDVARGPVTEDDALAIEELCEAFDEEKPSTPLPIWPNAPSHLDGYRKRRTRGNWMFGMHRYARHVDLLNTTVETVNRVAEMWVDGSSPYVEDGLSKGTVRLYQNAARIFYRYHDDVGVDHEEIQVFSRPETGIDPADMLDEAEFRRLRDAPDHPRDKCIIDLLLYTGMRNTALRTLRIKDVDVSDGTYRFNTDHSVLKNVYRPRAERPLLNARKAVRDWLEYHPSDDPDAFLVCGKPKWTNVDVHTPVTAPTIQRTVKSLKEDADIDKPLHPHAVRHNMVSICLRDYDMDEDTVRFLIGHSPDSRVMETTYSHLSGEDYRKKAEIAAGLREDDRSNTMAPTGECDYCGEPVPEGAKSCWACGTDFAPDGAAVRERVDNEMEQTKGAANALDDDTASEAVELFEEFIAENPEEVIAMAERKREDST